MIKENTLRQIMNEREMIQEAIEKSVDYVAGFLDLASNLLGGMECNGELPLNDSHRLFVNQAIGYIEIAKKALR